MVSAYVFDAKTGEQLHKLTADDGAASDYFGDAVSVNGRTLIVGAPWDVDAGSYSGSAYVFQQLCLADVNDDGVVDIDDLFAVLAVWGPCDDCPEDINDDGKVNIDDLFIILGEWPPCP